MAKIELKAPFNLGGQSLGVGFHDIVLVKDWFVDEMIHLGLIIEHEVDEVVEAVKPKRGKKVDEVVEAPAETVVGEVPEVESAPIEEVI